MKVSNLKEMLIKFYFGCDVRTKTFLEQRVDADTIAIACQEHFLKLEQSNDGYARYRITTNGKAYRDELQK